MALKPCIDCGTLSTGTRCPTHTAAKQRSKDARRPTRRTWAETKRRRAAVQAQPWCSACGAVTDLTADHIVPVAAGGPEDGPLRVLCRSCNSARGSQLIG